MKYTRRYS